MRRTKVVDPDGSTWIVSLRAAVVTPRGTARRSLAAQGRDVDRLGPEWSGRVWWNTDHGPGWVIAALQLGTEKAARTWIVAGDRRVAESTVEDIVARIEAGLPLDPAT